HFPFFISLPGENFPESRIGVKAFCNQRLICKSKWITVCRIRKCPCHIGFLPFYANCRPGRIRKCIGIFFLYCLYVVSYQFSILHHQVKVLIGRKGKESSIHHQQWFSASVIVLFGSIAFPLSYFCGKFNVFAFKRNGRIKGSQGPSVQTVFGFINFYPIGKPAKFCRNISPAYLSVNLRKQQYNSREEKGYSSHEH